MSRAKNSSVPKPSLSYSKPEPNEAEEGHFFYEDQDLDGDNASSPKEIKFPWDWKMNNTHAFTRFLWKIIKEHVDELCAKVDIHIKIDKRDNKRRIDRDMEKIYMNWTVFQWFLDRSKASEDTMTSMDTVNTIMMKVNNTRTNISFIHEHINWLSHIKRLEKPYARVVDRIKDIKIRLPALFDVIVQQFDKDNKHMTVDRKWYTEIIETCKNHATTKNWTDAKSCIEEIKSRLNGDLARLPDRTRYETLYFSPHNGPAFKTMLQELKNLRSYLLTAEKGFKKDGSFPFLDDEFLKNQVKQFKEENPQRTGAKVNDVLKRYYHLPVTKNRIATDRLKTQKRYSTGQFRGNTTNDRKAGASDDVEYPALRRRQSESRLVTKSASVAALDMMNKKCTTCRRYWRYTKANHSSPSNAEQNFEYIDRCDKCDQFGHGRRNCPQTDSSREDRRSQPQTGQEHDALVQHAQAVPKFQPSSGARAKDSYRVPESPDSSLSSSQTSQQESSDTSASSSETLTTSDLEQSKKRKKKSKSEQGVSAKEAVTKSTSEESSHSDSQLTITQDESLHEEMDPAPSPQMPQTSRDSSASPVHQSASVATGTQAQQSASDAKETPCQHCGRTEGYTLDLKQHARNREIMEDALYDYFQYRYSRPGMAWRPNPMDSEQFRHVKERRDRKKEKSGEATISAERVDDSKDDQSLDDLDDLVALIEGKAPATPQTKKGNKGSSPGTQAGGPDKKRKLDTKSQESNAQQNKNDKRTRPPHDCSEVATEVAPHASDSSPVADTVTTDTRRQARDEASTDKRKMRKGQKGKGKKETHKSRPEGKPTGTTMAIKRSPGDRVIFHGEEMRVDDKEEITLEGRYCAFFYLVNKHGKKAYYFDFARLPEDLLCMACGKPFTKVDLPDEKQKTEEMSTPNPGATDAPAKKETRRGGKTAQRKQRAESKLVAGELPKNHRIIRVHVPRLSERHWRQWSENTIVTLRGVDHGVYKDLGSTVKDDGTRVRTFTLINFDQKAFDVSFVED